MKNILVLLTLSALFLATIGLAEPQNTGVKKLVYKFNIKQNITPATWRQTKQAFELARTEHADLILIHMNTYGGTVVDADSIRTMILNSKIPVYVFIDNNAASAGALISIACDSIYMNKGASIGAATVVNQTGEAMPDKYQSYMRSTMRATAEAKGRDTIVSGQDTIIKWHRDPKIAEAMVDQRIYIEGISDTGKVVTFTPLEAIQHGFCEAITNDIDELLERANFNNYEIKEYKPSGLEKVIGFLVNPVVSGLLIMIIIGGIYFELQSPGIGFPLVAAITAATLYFAPLYLEGLAANWEILIFIAGLILIAMEIFIIPGFGVAGIAGIILAVGGLMLSLVGNVVFDFSGVEPAKITTALATVVIAMSSGFMLSLYLSKRLFTATSGLFKDFALHATQNREDGYIGVDTTLHLMIGKTGIAHTVLRPSGKVMIDGDLFDAKSEFGFIEKGETVVVVREEAAQLYVEKATN